MALIPKNNSGAPQRDTDRTAAREQVFLREVDDALREDDAIRLFRTYGRPLGFAVVAGLAALAGWMAWTNHVAAQAGQRGEALTVALDQVGAGRWAPAQASLKQIEASGGPGYAASARLIEGGIALDQKKPADAAKIYAAVAADPKVPQAYRDLALVREVATQFDQLPPQQVIDRLKPLAVPGNPWFGSAAEMTGIAQMRLGHTAEASALFVAMAHDTGVPQSLRGRARQLAAQLGADPGPDLSTTTNLAQ